MSFYSKLAKNISRETDAVLKYDTIEFNTTTDATSDAARIALQKASVSRNGSIAITGTNLGGDKIAMKSLNDVNSKLGATASDKWSAASLTTSSSSSDYAQLKAAALANLQAWVNGKVNTFNGTVDTNYGTPGFDLANASELLKKKLTITNAKIKQDSTGISINTNTSGAAVWVLAIPAASLVYNGQAWTWSADSSAFVIDSGATSDQITFLNAKFANYLTANQKLNATTIYNDYLALLGLSFVGANDINDRMAFGKAGLSYASFGYYAKERQSYAATGSADKKTLAADAFYGLGNENGVEIALADFRSGFNIPSTGAEFSGKTIAVLNVDGLSSRELNGDATLKVGQAGNPTLDLIFGSWYDVHFTSGTAANLEYKTGITTANGALAKSGWASNGAMGAISGAGTGFSAKYYGDGDSITESAGSYGASGTTVAGEGWDKAWSLDGAFGAKTATPIAKK
ncbi:MAG: hypothetical protein LBL46_03080 [Rickettsiales bacterium]|jgi:hypothetical protein|nr:hypothetical protein [Rickettsiales bacterium]